MPTPPLPHPRVLRAAHLLLAGALLACTGQALAQATGSSCGNLWVNNYGPFDYRTEQGFNKRIVEDHHFTPKVEKLIAGESAMLGADIDYTLRAFPNHHRALIAMVNLSRRARTDQPAGALFTVDCYFQRALTFRSDDQVARMLYAQYLASTARKSDALRQLEQTAQTAPDNPLTQYNIGLLLIEMGEFEKAARQVGIVEKLGADATRIRDRLQALGKWPAASEAATEPSAAPASASASASSP